MTFVERLQQAAKFAGLSDSQASIAVALGRRRQTVNRWFNGGEPNAEQIFHIARRFGVDAAWLKSEVGEMLSKPSDLSQEERDLIKHYRSATPQTRNVIRTMARAVRKTMVTIALAIPPLLMPQPAEAGISHNLFSLSSLSEYALRARRWFRWWLWPRVEMS